MAQQVMAPATKLKDLRSRPGTSTVKGKNWLLQAVLRTHTYTTNTRNDNV